MHFAFAYNKLLFNFYITLLDIISYRQQLLLFIFLGLTINEVKSGYVFNYLLIYYSWNKNYFS